MTTMSTDAASCRQFARLQDSDLRRTKMAFDQDQKPMSDAASFTWNRTWYINPSSSVASSSFTSKCSGPYWSNPPF